MNFISKLERKFGRFVIHNLMYYIVILYTIGTLINLFMPSLYITYLSLDGQAILRGEVWRIVTFLLDDPGNGNIFFSFIAIYLYYMIGTNLENHWGAFRFNLYMFVGLLGHVLAAIVLALLTDGTYIVGISYLNYSLFFAFAATYPNVEFLLFFVLPVKAKWLAWLDGIFFLYSFFMGNLPIRVSILLSLANFFLFFLATRNYKRISPREIHRKRTFYKSASQPSGITKHKCAICGRTELDGDDLEFRFCSRCEGNYEYCQDHLFTHQHVKK